MGQIWDDCQQSVQDSDGDGVRVEVGCSTATPPPSKLLLRQTFSSCRSATCTREARYITRGSICSASVGALANATLIIIIIISPRDSVFARRRLETLFSPPPIVFCFHLGPFFPRTKELSHTPLLTRNAHTSHNRSNLNCGEEWEASEKHRGVPADSQGLNSNKRGPEYLCISTITRRQSRRC